MPTGPRTWAAEQPELVQALDEMNWIIGADPGSPLAGKVEDAFNAALAALDLLVQDPPDHAGADAYLTTAAQEIGVAVSDEGLDPLEGQEIIDLLNAVYTDD